MGRSIINAFDALWSKVRDGPFNLPTKTLSEQAFRHGLSTARTRIKRVYEVGRVQTYSSEYDKLQEETGYKFWKKTKHGPMLVTTQNKRIIADYNRKLARMRNRNIRLAESELMQNGYFDGFFGRLIRRNHISRPTHTMKKLVHAFFYKGINFVVKPESS